MGALNTHQIGGEMGEAGLPFVNWSAKYGDLRIAHFFGIHALQIIPFIGLFMVARKVSSVETVYIVRVFSICYFAIVLLLLVQALMGTAIYTY